MKLKFKDILIIALATVTSFPVMYIVMMFLTGQARIEFGPEKDKEEKKDNIQLIKQSAHKDSLIVKNSRTYQALKQERSELEKERQRLREQQDRINLLQTEVEGQRRMISEEREKLEKLVKSSDSLSEKKLKDIAKVYGAMRPSEAATILGTMEDKTVASILRSISDDRQKAKILSLFSPEKAARVSRIIGAQ